MITIVIVHAQTQAREEMAARLSAEEDIKIIAQGKDGYDALKLAGSLKPDIVIMDNQLEFIEGQEIPPLIRARSPLTAVVLFVVKISDYQLFRAALNEVSAFVSSNRKTELEMFPKIIKYVSEGGSFISPHFAARILRLFGSMNGGKDLPIHSHTEKEREPHTHTLEAKFSPTEDPASFLSKTELQILSNIGKGWTSAEIAESLNLAVGTVRNYTSAIMRKTNLENRQQMIRYAYDYCLISDYTPKRY
jgi:DNA-binding NarL/FixJ family response regulator